VVGSEASDQYLSMYLYAAKAPSDNVRDEMATKARGMLEKLERERLAKPGRCERLRSQLAVRISGRHAQLLWLARRSSWPTPHQVTAEVATRPARERHKAGMNLSMRRITS
jgi:hypothetical protein